MLDPDDYWVEVIGQKPLEETESEKDTDTSTYRMVRGFQNVSHPLLTILEPYYDPGQGQGCLAELLSGCHGHDTETNV